MQNTFHINKLQDFIKSQKPLAQFLILGQTSLTSGLFCIETNTLVYYNLMPHANNINQMHLQDAIDISQKCNVVKSVVAINSEKFVLLPNTITEPAAQKNAIQLMHQVLPTDLLMCDTIRWQTMQNIFTLKLDTFDILHTIIKQPTIINLYSCILNNAVTIKNEGRNTIFLHTENNNMCLSVFVNNALQLHNVYEVLDTNDVLYHVQKTISVLQLQDVYMQISGFNSTQHLQLLCSIYDNVNLAQMPNGVIVGQVSEAQQQQLFSLYCLINQCV